MRRSLYAPCCDTRWYTTQTVDEEGGDGAGTTRCRSTLACSLGTSWKTKKPAVRNLAPKRLGLLREILPGVKRIGLLGNSADAGSTSDQVALVHVARALGLTLIVVSATNLDDFDAAIEALIRQRVEAVIAASSIAITRRERLLEGTNKPGYPLSDSTSTWRKQARCFHTVRP